MADTNKAALIARAEAMNAQYPQYAGYWNGPEWEVVTVVRDIRSKGRTIFTKGQQVLAKTETGPVLRFTKEGEAIEPIETWVNAFSWNTGWHCSLKPKEVRF